MKVIWKYQLEIGRQTLSMPVGAEVLSLGAQQEIPCIWVLVNPENSKVERIFDFYGTGHSIHEDIEDRKFIDTIQLEGGNYVFHLFEIS